MKLLTKNDLVALGFVAVMALVWAPVIWKAL
jgi:hypothetical protein